MNVKALFQPFIKTVSIFNNSVDGELREVTIQDTIVCSEQGDASLWSVLNRGGEDTVAREATLELDDDDAQSALVEAQDVDGGGDAQGRTQDDALPNQWFQTSLVERRKGQARELELGRRLARRVARARQARHL